MNRKRGVYFGLVILTIILGLLSRTSITPDFIYPYIGDALYAIMIYLVVAFFLNKKSIIQVGFIAVIICYLIEFSQFYHAPWIDEIRKTRIGGLILGFGFLWSDIVSYTVGVICLDHIQLI